MRKVEKNILHLVPKFFDDFGLQEMGWSVAFKKLHVAEYDFTLNEEHFKVCKPYYNKRMYVACKKGRKNFNGLFLNIDLSDLMRNENPLTVVYEWEISNKEGDRSATITHEIVYRVYGFDSQCNAITNDVLLMGDKRDIKGYKEPYITLYDIKKYHNKNRVIDTLLKVKDKPSIITKRKEYLNINAIPESYLSRETPFRTPELDGSFDVDSSL